MKALPDDMAADPRGAWIERFEPSRHWPSAHAPVLRVSGTNDGDHPLDSLQRSYMLSSGARTLRITVAMPHGPAAGWEPLELYAFADQHPRGGTPLPAFGSIVRDGVAVRAQVRSEVLVASAALHVTADGIAWPRRRRTSTPATHADDGWEGASLPRERPLCSFLTVTGIRELTVSTPREEIGWQAAATDPRASRHPKPGAE